MATGLLPVCFGEATKLSAYLLDSDKRYRVTAQFGTRTSTGDAEGEVIERAAPPSLTSEAVEAVFRGHLGVQQQQPPMYSALKHQGQRLYALARQGIEVERALRDITIHELRLLGAQGSQLEFEVHCSKGTYIRTLVEDLARSLGSCAHVRALRRLAVGPFGEPMYSLEQLGELAAQSAEALTRCLLPPAGALQGWPQLTLADDAAFYLGRGEPVRVPKAPREGQVALFDRQGELLGIGRIDADGLVAPQRLLNRPKPAGH